MDIVHHAMIGGAGMLALAAQDQALAGLGFLAGSVFPDLAVFGLDADPSRAAAVYAALFAAYVAAKHLRSSARRVCAST